MLAISPVYETIPVGSTSARYLNAVLLARPAWPRDLLDAIGGIEARFGRGPGRAVRSRTLDIDIYIGYSQARSAAGADPAYPRTSGRFVLAWRDIDPSAELPGSTGSRATSPASRWPGWTNAAIRPMPGAVLAGPRSWSRPGRPRSRLSAWSAL